MFVTQPYRHRAQQFLLRRTGRACDRSGDSGLGHQSGQRYVRMCNAQIACDLAYAARVRRPLASR